MDATIIGLLTVLLGGSVAGFWQWFSNRKKAKVEAETTAQGAILNGFMQLLAEFKAERSELVRRLVAMEENNQKQDRRIAQLEHALIANNIAIPEDKPT